MIYGGIGNDFIAGDGGTDDIYGGAGDDTFYIFATSGIDRIKDYSEVDDGFLFFQTGATQWSDLVFTVSGSDVHITHSGSSFTVIVEGATLADLDNSAGNFSFL